MTEEIGTRVRDLLRTDPQLAIVLGEILGPPVASPEAPPHPW